MFRKISCVRFDGERFEKIVHEVVEEVPMALFVNGRHAMTAMMSPADLEDFVIGYLFTEEIIRGPGEIESIRIEKNRVSVLTTNPFKSIGTKKTILSGCGGSVSYIDTEKLPKVHSDLTVTPAGVLGAVQSVLTSDLHRATGGVHIVALLDRGEVITVAEDIGRHNALDRVIGYGLRKGVDFSRTYVVSSGRISSEMVRKCLVANIPLIVSRGATTSLAVEMAEKTGLTVVGFARGGKLNIYSHPCRVEGAGQKTE
ncbi:formate dehydrogenase accessory sulfurtransferase FdhD [uncultured Methanofollis sp.]|uniref:formate dehydrogenase accessory sulfurtransferase FdhD n=1 Tax=uncultured Methanofollis sp. TaxID=262500 RepID=UPI002608125D|nr:formate dehydrogenase accessory sulfurtransferase FdhD [uncultured Methanofollis sp.]